MGTEYQLTGILNYNLTDNIIQEVRENIRKRTKIIVSFIAAISIEIKRHFMTSPFQAARHLQHLTNRGVH